MTVQKRFYNAHLLNRRDVLFSGCIIGAVVAFVWGKAKWLGLYEIIPGFFLGLLAIVVVSLLTYRPNKEIDETFDAAIAHLKEEMKK